MSVPRTRPASCAAVLRRPACRPSMALRGTPPTGHTLAGSPAGNLLDAPAPCGTGS
jgi:hypothetical protein